MGRMATMANRTTWEQRVAAWRTSGLTAAAFCAQEGLGRRAFSRWLQRLPSETARVSSSVVASPVRLARLLRTAPPAVAAPAVASDPIEVGGARVTVGHGADLAMVVTVLSMVGAGGGR